MENSVRGAVTAMIQHVEHSGISSTPAGTMVLSLRLRPEAIPHSAYRPGAGCTGGRQEAALRWKVLPTVQAESWLQHLLLVFS